MELTLTTPALLFPTISLLILAYTNRFIAIGNRIRNLHGVYVNDKSEIILGQIQILRLRVRMIRDLQIVGIVCLFFCVLTMFLIFENQAEYAKHSFEVSLILLMIAFGFSAWEIILSTRALNLQLKGLEEKENLNNLS
jgi:hypothetical protein